MIGPLWRSFPFGGYLWRHCRRERVFAVASFIYTHVKFDIRVPGYTWRQSFKTIHATEIWQSFYDYNLNENVGYAKHAISIDENRKDFARVPWDAMTKNSNERDALSNLWFEQVWFSGVTPMSAAAIPRTNSTCPLPP